MENIDMEGNSLALFSELRSALEENNMVVEPNREIHINSKPKLSLKKSFVGVKLKSFADKIKKGLPYIYNFDKYAELGYEYVAGKVLDKTAAVKKKAVKFKEGIAQKFDSAKSFVTSMPKKAKEVFSEKKEIIVDRKANGGLKASMEKVYGEEKDRHLDYRIVNRIANFKENTCQRVNERRKITSVKRSFIDKIRAPFDKMRDTLQKDAMRNDLKAKIVEVKEENRRKAEALKRVKTMENGGYILTSLLITSGIVLLAFGIFTFIKVIIL